MSSDPTLPPDLIEAYRATDFRVHAQPPFVLKIDVASPPLAELYLYHGCNCAAFITACNPYGEELEDAKNSALQQALAHELSSIGLPFLPGMGVGHEDEWAGEPSYLVMGLDQHAASAMGRKYRQNAIVWCDSDAVPQLVLLRGHQTD